MKAEFQAQIKINKTEWENFLKNQKKNDGDGDKKLREKDERMKTTIYEMIATIKSLSVNHTTSYKRILNTLT